MRADAQANRQRILSAAREVYGERGMIAPYAAIAERAGIGIGTLYRHFPTPGDLHEGIAEAFSDDLAASAAKALWKLDASPDTVWIQFIDELADLKFAGFAPQIVDSSPDGLLPPELLSARSSIVKTVDGVLDAARQHGLIAVDVSARQFLLGVAIASRPLAKYTQSTAPEHSHWMLQVFARGIRPSDQAD